MKKLAVFLAFVMLVCAGKLSAQVTSPDQSRPQEEVHGWKKIEGLPETLRNFSFPDGGRWYAGTMYRTYFSDDRGETWTAMPNPLDSPRMFSNHQFVTRDMGLATDGGTVYRTIDGGITWTASQVSGNAIDRLRMFDPAVGVADTRIHTCITFDSAKTWTCNPMLAVPINDVFFVTPEVGFAVGTSLPWFEPFHPSAATFQRTSDGGKTWEMVYTGFDEDWRRVFASSPETVIVFGEAGNVYKSVDGGSSWKKSSINPPEVAFFDLSFTSPTTAYAGAGLGGFVMHTTNAGEFWFAVASVGNLWWQEIAFIDSLTGFISGEYGVWKTTSGGMSWVPIKNANKSSLRLHPNPAYDQVTFDYALETPEMVTISIWDAAGREVLRLPDHRGLVGVNTKHITLAHLSPGAYICKLLTASFMDAIPFHISR